MAFANSGTSRAQSCLKFRVRIHSIVESHARQRHKQNVNDQGQEKTGRSRSRMSTFRGIMNARSTAQRQPDAAVPISLQPAHANARRTLIRVFPDAEMAAQADVAGKA
ncbi:hypothetical protein [Burkholderia ubonensis]|uniref:hypothetical protein n=1 Tax=Burkholderia ubonensis TaxID=101571 RepID=UPI000AF2ED15|nr:hypothetical protein [Burkholderia ubonensis]